MNKITARRPEDQIIIDDHFRKLNEQERINDELWNENNSLRKDLKKPKKKFDGYSVRYPENVGVKNGKPYFYKPKAKNEKKCDAVDGDSATVSIPKMKAGARIGHCEYQGPVPDLVDRERNVSITECPHCPSDLIESFTTRTRIIEGMPVKKPIFAKYTIERRYCSSCTKMVETMFSLVLPRAALFLRTILVIVYMKTVERLSAARVSKLMKDLFALHVTKDECKLH